MIITFSQKIDRRIRRKMTTKSVIVLICLIFLSKMCLARSLHGTNTKDEIHVHNEERNNHGQMPSLFNIIGKGGILNILDTLLYGRIPLDSDTGLTLDTLGKGNIL